MIQLTGVASRYVGIWIAALLIILGLLPAVAGVIQAVPQAVLGGAVMVMFGAVAASGINILSGVALDRRALTDYCHFIGLRFRCCTSSTNFGTLT